MLHRPLRRRPLVLIVIGTALPIVPGCAVSVGQEGGPSGGIAGAGAPRERPGAGGSGLRNQLRNELEALFRAEQRYFALHETYTDEIYALQGDDVGAYYPAPEVRVRIPVANEKGFSAVAARAHAECALRVGDVPPPRSYATARGVAVCRP